ncbi:MAG: hypothetical protein EOP50_17415, partial [Sphingobacteriales bacterium]
MSGAAGLVYARRETTTTNTYDSADIVITALVDGTFAGTVRNKANTSGSELASAEDDGELVVRGVANQTFIGTLDLSKDMVVGHGATLTLAGNVSLRNQAKGSVVLNGGTFQLDNRTTNNANRLRDGGTAETGLETIGGGTFTLFGHSSGTTELIGRLQMGTASNARSGAVTINVVQPVSSTNATELRFQSLSRDSGVQQYSTIHFNATDSNGTVRELGLAGNNPRISFATVPLTGNGGLLKNTSAVGTSGTGWATLSRPGAGGAINMDFATVAPTTGFIAAVTTQNGFNGSSLATNVLVTSSITLNSGSNTSAASVKFAPDSDGQELVISGGGRLNSNGFL